MLTFLVWFQGLWAELNALFKEENDTLAAAGGNGDMEGVHLLVV